MIEPASPPDAAHSPRAAWRGPAALLGFVGVFWVCTLNFPTVVARPELDISWSQALGHALSHRMQAGVDYVFTYGPLGYFATTTYSPDLFWWHFGWEVLLKLGIAVAAGLGLYRAGTWRGQGLLLVALALLPGWFSDVLYPLGLLVAYLAATRGRCSLTLAVLAAALCGVLSLVKLTFFVLSVPTVACLALHWLRGPARSWRRAALPPLVFLGTYVGLWLALGQALANLPRYFLGSLNIVAGYTEAMSLSGDSRETWLALGILAALGATLLARRPGRVWGLPSLLTAGLIAAFLFEQWKHGFVRADCHTVPFFCFTLLLACFFPAAFPGHDWRAAPRLLALGLALGLSAYGTFRAASGGELSRARDCVLGSLSHVRFSWGVLWRPEQSRAGLEAQLAAMDRQTAMPRTRAEVGAATVDWLSCELGMALANKLNWHPRLAFQSYTAYTEYLLDANAAWFRGPDAPAYVIVDLAPIDEHFPTLEDGKALLEIIARYEPVLTERSCVLLKRRPDADTAALSWRTTLQRRIGIGEEMAVPAAPHALQALSLTIRPSWKGRLRGLLFKPPVAFVTVRTASGEALAYRVVPAMARSRFLLNPFVQSTRDFVNLYGEAAGKTVVSLRLWVDGCSYFDDSVEVRIEECARPAPGAVSPERARALAAELK
jgi:hypothetical protein